MASTPLTGDDVAPGDGTTCPDVMDVVHRVELWRQSVDVLYRLFTSEDDTELFGYVAGLVGGGSDPDAEGLVLARYRGALLPTSRRLLGDMRRHVNSGNWQRDRSRAEARTMCHYLILAALVLEHEFVNYVVLSVYDRDSLRSYITEYLAPTLSKFLQGGLHQLQARAQVDAFGVTTFVGNSIAQYAIRCMPKESHTNVPSRGEPPSVSYAARGAVGGAGGDVTL